jgi:hypothetical protein
VHDYTGVVLYERGSHPDVMFTYEVDEDGYPSGPASQVWRPDPLTYRERFAAEPTYICECSAEYMNWPDMDEHLALFAPEQETTVPTGGSNG